MSLHPQMASFSSPCAVTSCRRTRSSRILSCLILRLLFFSLLSLRSSPFLLLFFLLQLLLLLFFSPFLLLLWFSPFPFLPSSISSSTLHLLLVLHLGLWHQLLENEEEEASFCSPLSPPPGERGAAAICLFSSCCSSFPSHPLFSLPPPYLLLPPLSFFQLFLFSLRPGVSAGSVCNKNPL